MRTLLAFGATTVFAFAQAGVGEAQQYPAQSQQPQQSQQSQFPAQQQQQPPANVVAVVNDDPITQQEVQATLRPHLEANPQAGPQVQQQMEQQVLKSLIDGRLVEQYMLENGPDVSQQEVQSVTQQVKQQVEAQGADYQQFLARRGQTEQSIAQRIEGSLAWQKYQQQNVTEPRLQQFYESNKQQFGGQPYEQVRNQVAQMYTTTLWTEVANQARPEAEIQILSRPGARQQPRTGGQPGGNQQQGSGTTGGYPQQ